MMDCLFPTLKLADTGLSPCGLGTKPIAEKKAFDFSRSFTGRLIHSWSVIGQKFECAQSLVPKSIRPYRDVQEKSPQGIIPVRGKYNQNRLLLLQTANTYANRKRINFRALAIMEQGAQAIRARCIKIAPADTRGRRETPSLYVTGAVRFFDNGRPGKRILVFGMRAEQQADLHAQRCLEATVPVVLIAEQAQFERSFQVSSAQLALFIIVAAYVDELDAVRLHVHYRQLVLEINVVGGYPKSSRKAEI